MAGTIALKDPDTDCSDNIRSRLGALVRVLDDGDDDDASEQVLMDADLDGRRYLLIRMPTIERKSASLSPREVEIVRLVAEGHPNKVIAAVLEISSWTVCTHVRRVFAKLGVTSRAAMVARAVEFAGSMDVGIGSIPVRKRGGDEAADARPRAPVNGRSSLPNHVSAARFTRTRTGDGDGSVRRRNVS